MTSLVRERVHGREITLVPLSPEWRWPFEEEVEWLTLFIAADTNESDDARIAAFAGEALRHRCAYMSAWGRGCERVENVFDTAYIADPRHQDHGDERDWSDEIPFLMTTSHPRDSLASALWFALTQALPDMEHISYAEAATSKIVVLAQPHYLDSVRDYLLDQERLDRDSDE